MSTEAKETEPNRRRLTPAMNISAIQAFRDWWAWTWAVGPGWYIAGPLGLLRNFAARG